MLVARIQDDAERSRGGPSACPGNRPEQGLPGIVTGIHLDRLALQAQGLTPADQQPPTRRDLRRSKDIGLGYQVEQIRRAPVEKPGELGTPNQARLADRQSLEQFPVAHVLGGGNVDSVELREETLSLPKIGTMLADQRFKIPQSGGQTLKLRPGGSRIVSIFEQVGTGLFALKNRGFTPFFTL